MNKMNIIPHKFNGLEFNLIEKNDNIWFTGEQIGEALEYAEPAKAIRKIYERNQEELDNYSSCVNLTHEGFTRKTRCFTEQGTMIITMLSRQPKARKFREWAVEILKSYRNGELVAMGTKAQQLMLIDKTFHSATRIAKNAGLKGNKLILKAAKTTKNSIGVDVFEYLGEERPENKEPAEDFFTVLDQLLKDGLVKNYCLDGSKIYVRMKEVFKAAKKHQGLNSGRSDYLLIKQNPLFISAKKKVHNRLSNKFVISVWVFSHAL